MPEQRQEEHDAERRHTLIQVRSTRTPQGDFTLHATPDGMQAYLSCELMDSGIGRAKVAEILEKLGVTHGVIDSALDDVVAHAHRREPLAQLPVARGTPVVEGRSARLDFKKRPAGFMAKAATDDKRVDYRELAGLENVKEGDHIATYIPAIDGHGGIDVFGKVIPAQQIQGLKVEAGENVVYQEESRRFYASSHGHVRFEQGVVSVSATYAIPGSLTMAHGNIKFIGRVEIGRDVPDEFRVEAAQGIAIGGTAEACILRSGSEITINGGVTGKGKGRIRCKGALRARFLNEVEVHAGGDVIIQKEIVKAKVYTRGRLVLEAGTVVGSEIVALRGILCRDAGSDLGVKTKLVAGLDYKVHERIIDINRDLLRQRKRQQALMNQAGPIMRKASKAAAMSRSTANDIKELFHTIRDMQRNIERLERESGEAMDPFEKLAVNCISITRDCFPGIEVVVGQYLHEVKSRITGPVSFHPDPIQHQVAIRNERMVERLWAQQD